MAKTRAQKEEIIKALTDGFTSAKSAVFVNFDGLNVSDTQAFRRACRLNGLSYLVAKKTLLKLALAKANLQGISLESFTKGVGTVFGQADEVAPAQTVDVFAKTHANLTILGGLMNGNTLTLAEVSALAKLPSKDQLLAKLVATINAPISGFVNVLAGNLRGLATVLNAIKDQKA